MIAGVAILAVGAGAWLLMPDSDDEATTAQAEVRKRDGERRGPRGRTAASDDDLVGRVSALEDEVAQMRREMKKLRMVRGSAVARGATVGSDESGQNEAPAFEGAVRDIIEVEREEAREKRTDAMRERFSDRHGEILDELVAVAGLNKDERESIEGLWETEMEQMIPLFMAAREGERPFGEVREEAEKLRNATDGSVEEMLTPEQFEQYKEMRPGPPGRRRGGQRRGPPPG